MRRLGRWQLIAYGLLGLPLAMAALPLYVHLPKFYGDDLGMSLALVGGILLGARLVDAVQDPLLGYWSDRAPGRKRFIAVALPLLGGGMLALFNPPELGPAGLAGWLLGCLIVVYLGFSMASISYQAWGAQLSDDRDERTRITASRETFTLIGVVTAAALPALLGSGGAQQLSRFAALFVLLLAGCAWVTLRFSPERAAAPRPRPGPGPEPQRGGMLAALLQPMGNAAFRRLLVVFVLNGIASAIPATLVMFFMADVLQLGERAGLFLALYFISGAAGMPLWVWLSRRVGKRRAWLAGMILSIAAFVWAYGLGAGDAAAFGAVCVMSGVALGADLALPPAILADVMDQHPGGDAGGRGEGAYFGLWNLVTKLNLALAAGISLPLLGALGYVPGAPGGAAALSLAYCLIPCALKLLAVAALSFARLDPPPLAGA